MRPASRVQQRLATLGVTDVAVPTLTGLGDRRDELHLGIGLRTHVEDLVAVLDAADQPVILAGHSYSGLVAREAADRRPDAVRHLVLVDGWAGADGASLVGLAPSWMADAMTAGAASSGDGWRV